MTTATIDEKRAAWLGDTEVWLSTGEIARKYGKTAKTVYVWMKRGIERPSGRVRLQFKWIGRQRMSTPEWVEKFIDALNAEEPAVAEPTRTRESQARRDQAEAAQALGGKRKRGG